MSLIEQHYTRLYFTKRLLDYTLAFLLITILSPLFIIIPILIKTTSRGPILFKQERLGKDGAIFTIYKFRTMVKDAEKIDNSICTNENDSRITSLGKILRSTSLDELPQIINVIKGDMSFIGPRPLVPYYPYKLKDYSEKHKVRFSVLPGITGYAQVMGRNKLSWNEKFNLDVEYVENYSLIMDMKIIILTAHRVFTKEDIY